MSSLAWYLIVASGDQLLSWKSIGPEKNPLFTKAGPDDRNVWT